MLVGSLGGVASPARHDTDLMGADLDLDGPVELPLTPTHEHGLVVLSGRLAVDGVTIGPDQLAYLGRGRPHLSIDADGPTRALLLGGEPFGQDILMWWNFVARTRDEVTEAWRAWDADDGRFGSVASTLSASPPPGPNGSPLTTPPPAEAPRYPGPAGPSPAESPSP